MRRRACEIRDVLEGELVEEDMAKRNREEARIMQDMSE